MHASRSRGSRIRESTTTRTASIIPPNFRTTRTEQLSRASSPLRSRFPKATTTRFSASLTRRFLAWVSVIKNRRMAAPACLPPKKKWRRIIVLHHWFRSRKRNRRFPCWHRRSCPRRRRRLSEGRPLEYQFARRESNQWFLRATSRSYRFNPCGRPEGNESADRESQRE